jgi:hypothetical protein
MMKGTSPLIGGVFLVLSSIIVAMIVSSWVTDLSESKSSFITNRTKTQLSCQYASIYVRNVTFECADSCFSGTPYKINATIENTGTTKIVVSDLLLSMDNGLSYIISGNTSSVSSGISLVKNFNSILVSNASTNLTFNVSHPSLKSVFVYNENNVQVYSANVSGNSHDSSIISSSSFHRIVVEDISGVSINKYHPFRNGGECTTTSSLDEIKISLLNCPEISTSYKGSDVFFVNC